MKKYAPFIVRTAISLIFLWFGLTQIINPDMLIGYLPEFAYNMPLSPNTLLLMHGVFETAFGLLLLLGLFTRIAALLLMGSLFVTAVSLGYNDVAIRDFGLVIVTFSIVLNGPDEFSLDNKLNLSFLNR